MLLSTARFVWGHPGNAGHRGRAMARFVGWQAWQRVVRRPWTVAVHGRHLRCYPHSTAAAAVIYCGLPEWEDMRFVLDYLRTGDAFVDVGANVGVYALLASAVEGVDVVAFEPSSDNRRRLEENVRLNRLEGRVAVAADAVGAAEGTAAFTTGLDTVNHLLDPGVAPMAGAEWVRTVTLDGALGPETRRRVALVKIDVEGGEPQVLSGAEALIAEGAPAFIVERNDPAALGRFFADQGYVTCRYEPVARRLEACPITDVAGNNVIAVPDLEAACARLQVDGSAGSSREEVPTA